MKLTDIAAPDYFHKVVDCQWACPAHTPVPEYIRLIAQGRYGDAYMINWKSNVFPGNPRTHLRPPVRAGLPARPRREGAGRDLPPEARRRRLQGRHHGPAAEGGREGQAQRQAHRAGRRRPCLAHRRARSRADGLRMRGVRRRLPLRRHDALADSKVSPARQGDRRGVQLHPRSRRRVPRRAADRQPEGAAEPKAGTRSSSAPARRAGASSTSRAARKRRRTSTSASTGCRRSRSATSTRSASASSCSAAATPRWTAAAPRAASAART